MSAKSTTGAHDRTVTRRTVIRGAAWSLPVIAVAVATPFATASTTGGSTEVPGGGSTPGTGGTAPIVPSYQTGSFCKHPGNPKYYHGTFSFENTTSAPIVLTLTSMLVNGTSKDAKFSVNNRLVSTYTVPAKTKISLYVDAGLFDDSANGTATLSFAYAAAGVTRTGSVSAPLGSLPPCAGDVKGTPAHSHSGPTL